MKSYHALALKEIKAQKITFILILIAIILLVGRRLLWLDRCSDWKRSRIYLHYFRRGRNNRYNSVGCCSHYSNR